MFYREAGQFKTTYAADQSVFPINLDRWFIAAALVVAFLVIPLTANEYWLQAILIPILVFTMAAIGLNLLVGYAGQLSLGTGGFMAVGGFMTYKITTAFPELNIILVFLASGLCAGGEQARHEEHQDDVEIGKGGGDLVGHEAADGHEPAGAEG